MGTDDDPVSRDPDQIDALLSDFGDRSGPNPALEPEVEPLDEDQDEDEPQEDSP
jgi:hypothetical protein